MSDPSVYDYLAKQNISELTVENLNSMTKVSAIDPSNLEFWAGVITVSRALEHSRTFPHGLPIPGTSTIETTTIADGASGYFGPNNNEEIWLLQGISLDNCQAALVNSDDLSLVVPLDISAAFSNPIYLTKGMWVVFNNASGAPQTPVIAYHKVAL